MEKNLLAVLNATRFWTSYKKSIHSQFPLKISKKGHERMQCHREKKPFSCKECNLILGLMKIENSLVNSNCQLKSSYFDGLAINGLSGRASKI